MTLIDRWLPYYKPLPAPRHRLFCFPYAGGAAHAFRLWSSALAPEIEVCAIQPPGRWTRRDEPSFTAAQPFADALAHDLSPLLQGQFAFFAHSMGTLVAFELARALRRQGSPLPTHMIMSARRAPHIPSDDPNAYVGLTDEQLVAKVSRRYGGIPAAVLQEPELLALVVPPLRADLQLYEHYSYAVEAPLDCPLIVLGGTTDPNTTTDSLQAWQDHTTQTIDLQMFPGGHFFVDESRAAILERVRSLLL